jgi:hypothetical protein
MEMKRFLMGLPALLVLSSTPAIAQPSAETKSDAIIPYYATLDRGLAEAKRTGKPILFVSAAPHCAGVSGKC